MSFNKEISNNEIYYYILIHPKRNFSAKLNTVY